MPSPARNELVFAGRHQAYGADQLRRDHHRVMAIALLATVAIVWLLLGLPRLFATSSLGLDAPWQNGIIVELDKFAAQATKSSIPQS